MISGGISKNGLDNLIFHSGNVNNFSYKQVLHFYKKDFINLEIKNLFGDNFISKWDEGPKLNGK